MNCLSSLLRKDRVVLTSAKSPCKDERWLCVFATFSLEGLVAKTQNEIVEILRIRRLFCLQDIFRDMNRILHNLAGSDFGQWRIIIRRAHWLQEEIKMPERVSIIHCTFAFVHKNKVRK